MADLSKLGRSEISTLRGHFSPVVTGSECTKLAIAMNNNADILQQVCNIIKDQQDEINELRSEIDKLKSLHNTSNNNDVQEAEIN